MCPICLIDDKHVVIKTECKHEFHKECIDKWVLQCQTNNKLSTCPICRANLSNSNHHSNLICCFKYIGKFTLLCFGLYIDCKLFKAGRSIEHRHGPITYQLYKLLF